MSPLIAVREREIGGVLQPTVDGRDLWEFFMPRDSFAGWMKRKLEQHACAEGTDYVRRRQRRDEVPAWEWKRVAKQMDYVLTINAAERIGAMEVCRGPVPWV